MKRMKEGAQTCLFSHLLAAQSCFDLWTISVRKLQKIVRCSPDSDIQRCVCLCVCDADAARGSDKTLCEAL